MKILSYFSPKMPQHLTYMLQQVEYEPDKFVEWLRRLPDLHQVERRKNLILTAKAKILLTSAYIFWLVIVLISVFLMFNNILAGLAIVILSPLFLVFIITLLVSFAWLTIENPRRKKAINEAEILFKMHPAVKIAVLGSYGKTTVKELLGTVLGEGKKVASSPLNRNVPISHARWVKTLDGDEDIIIVEFGESKPGDIENLAEIIHPNKAILTGLAPNHLDKYKTVENLTNDLFDITKYVSEKNIYLNSESKNLLKTAQSGYKPFNLYDQKGVDDVSIDNIKMDFLGMDFSVRYSGNKKLNLKTKLIGSHLLGTLAVCIDLANEFGLSDAQIRSGISKTTPFEHRLYPRHINGAWIIDDTYNGNLEGIRVGLDLLRELPAKRKIYVTPGLVDQGQETEKVHIEIGKLITETNPQKVVLMKNSVTNYIKNGLKMGNYKGEIDELLNPLEFYQGLEHIVAAGDLVLMQNDWTDNYT